jgi:hypothetical protein
MAPQVLGPSQLLLAAFAGLIALQGSMINLGYESNAQVSGNYLRSLAADVSEQASDQTLILVDPGGGRGDTLNALIALPAETEAFFLSRQAAEWPDQVAAFSQALDGRQEVWITYSIMRGQFGADKAGLYQDFVTVLEARGFERRDVGSRDRSNFQAVWTRPS